jgi:thiol-disulfide isomerase/thioredoxin
MNRRHLAFAGLGVAAAAAGMAWQSLRSRQDPAAGTAAAAGAASAAAAGTAGAEQAWWAQQLEKPDGTLLSVASLRGAPLIVNFWATWCPPCVREMPMIERFYQSQASRGGLRWRILGLAVDRREAVAEYLKRQPVSYDIGVAGIEALQWGRAWGNEKGGLPFTVALAADGRVLQRKLGELAEGEMDDWRPA